MVPKLSDRENLDRFIPNRSAMDFDYAHYMLTGGRVEKENASSCSPSKHLYRKRLVEIFNMNRTRILAFKNKPAQLAKKTGESCSPALQTKPIKPRRHIAQSPERVLDAPDILDDFYLNLLDWSSSNTVAVALGNTVYLWDASSGSISELLSIGDDIGPVTSVKWAVDGKHIAVGLNNSHVQLWDALSIRLLRTLRGHHLRVSSLDWNDHILTTGGLDSLIINNDARIRSPIVGMYRGHSHEVCGLKWCSSSGRHLASGGNDNLIFIWNASMTSANSSTRWLHRLDEHSAAIKALSWCPFQSNLLASGGGAGDHMLKFWNVNTGACLNSVSASSPVCSLLWSTHERELLSGHGNQLSLWKYPSMVKISELFGHTSRVLSMAKSPDGCTVASAAGDETLRFWNVFGDPQLGKTKTGKKEEPFSNIPRIR